MYNDGKTFCIENVTVHKKNQLEKFQENKRVLLAKIIFLIF